MHFQKKNLEKDFKLPKEIWITTSEVKTVPAIVVWLPENPRNLSNGQIIIKEKPLQQIQFIDIVGKGKKLPRNNDNIIISKNNLQNINKPNVIVNKCQVRTCPYFGQYHQSNSMRQTAV